VVCYTTRTLYLCCHQIHLDGFGTPHPFRLGTRTQSLFDQYRMVCILLHAVRIAGNLLLYLTRIRVNMIIYRCYRSFGFGQSVVLHGELFAVEVRKMNAATREGVSPCACSLLCPLNCALQRRGEQERTVIVR
jgi:hypothetical protein